MLELFCRSVCVTVKGLSIGKTLGIAFGGATESVLSATLEDILSNSDGDGDGGDDEASESESKSEVGERESKSPPSESEPRFSLRRAIQFAEGEHDCERASFGGGVGGGSDFGELVRGSDRRGYRINAE